MIGQPKFNVDDVVFYVTTSVNQVTRPCPDCMDTHEWDAVSALGERFKVSCGRCRGSAPSWVKPLVKQVATYAVRQLTIGSVRLDTAEERRTPWSYMCRETGVGSGSIYYEDDFHVTESAAEADAKGRAAVLQGTLDEKPDQLRTEDASRLSLHAAIETGWNHSMWDSWYIARELKEAVVEFFNESGGDPTRDQLDELREKTAEITEQRPWRKPHPLDALLSAIRGSELNADPRFGAILSAVEDLERRTEKVDA